LGPGLGNDCFRENGGGKSTLVNPRHNAYWLSMKKKRLEDYSGLVWRRILKSRAGILTKNPEGKESGTGDI